MVESREISASDGCALAMIGEEGRYSLRKASVSC